MSESSVIATEPVLHIMYDGQGHDIALRDLDIGDASTDEQVKQSVANHFSIPESKLRFFQVDRQTNGNVTVRPQAVFG